MSQRWKSRLVRATLVVMAVMGTSALSPQPAAQAATTTNCPYGVVMRVADLPVPRDPTLRLGTSCTGFSDAGAPYVFLVGQLDLVATKFPMNVYFNNVTANCTSYFYSGGSLTATGCTYTLHPN